MQFKDEGYIAAIRRYGENSLIVNVITKEHGLIGGFVKGGGSKKNAGIYQPGNRISVDAYARIEENMLSLKTELLAPTAVSFMNSPAKLAALSSLCSLCAACLPEKENLERQIVRLGVGAQVRLLGRIEHQFLPPYYHACDLFTTASLSEMNSISMLEAMASGLYVIQRLDIYNKNQITPGENVFNTAEEMAALLREEAALTPEQRALRRQKVTAFTQRYGEKEFIRAVLNVYERAMAEYKAKMKIKAKAKSKGVR